MNGLSEKHLRWFEDGRHIPAEVVARFEIYTARWDAEHKQSIADLAGDWIVFPYVERGTAVAEHCRTPIGKKFIQSAGGKKTFWNAPSMTLLFRRANTRLLSQKANRML